MMSDRVATELVSKALGDEGTPPDWEKDTAAATLLARALNGARDAALDCRLSLRQPLVAIGAPVEAYLPRTARQLHTELIIPEHAGVANALEDYFGEPLRDLLRPERGLDDPRLAAFADLLGQIVAEYVERTRGEGEAA